MEILEDLIAEIESRIAEDGYKDGDEDVGERQSQALVFLLAAVSASSDLSEIEISPKRTFSFPSPDIEAFASRDPYVVQYSYVMAINGLKAAAETTAAQYRRTNSSRYSRLMDIVLAELARIVRASLQYSASSFRPLTDAFRNASSDLKAAHREAESAINVLGITTSILEAFRKLVAAL